MLNKKVHNYLKDKEEHEGLLSNGELGIIVEDVQNIAINEYKKTLLAKVDDIFSDYCNGKGKLTDILEDAINNTKI